MVARDVVWAEVATAYGHAQNELVETLRQIGVRYSAMSLDAALAVDRCRYTFRVQGDRRNRIAADSLIGGHAWIQTDRLSTRDRGFYRNYITQLMIMTPSISAGHPP